MVKEPLNKPSGGSITILPTSGFAYSTLFTLQVSSSWHLDTDTDLRYRFWGLTTLSDNEEHIALTEPYPYDGHAKNITIVLPNIVAIDCQLFGNTGQSTYYRLPVSV